MHINRLKLKPLTSSTTVRQSSENIDDHYNHNQRKENIKMSINISKQTSEQNIIYGNRSSFIERVGANVLQNSQCKRTFLHPILKVEKTLNRNSSQQQSKSKEKMYSGENMTNNFSNISYFNEQTKKTYSSFSKARNASNPYIPNSNEQQNLQNIRSNNKGIAKENSQQKSNNLKQNFKEDATKGKQSFLLSEYEDVEKKYESKQNKGFEQGIRIKINKEYRILSHLEKQHQNTNLLFYNFNQFSEDKGNEIFFAARGSQQNKMKQNQEQHMPLESYYQSAKQQIQSNIEIRTCESRKRSAALDDGKEFKKSSRSKFQGRNNQSLIELGFLNNKNLNQKRTNNNIENKIEEEDYLNELEEDN